MVSFDSTEIAFRIKADKELRKALFLFRAISSKTLVRIGGFLSRIAISIHFPISWIVKPTIYRHFCGGVTMGDCLPTVEKLASFGVKSVLDYSVEGKEEPEEIEAVLQETLSTVINASHNDHIPFAVFKPTAFGRSEVLEKKSNGESLNAEEEAEALQFRERIRRLCHTAYENDVCIMIDAEEVRYQAFIDEVAMEMMEQYNRQKAIVYNTCQMYRTDRLEVLKKDYEAAVEKQFFLGIKFVRGAYMERERERAARLGYPSPIQPDKEATDRNFDAGLKFSVEHIDRIAIFNGTHNEKSSLYLAQLMEEHKLPNDDERCYFSQLYGMSDHISFNLAHEGYNVAKYLPYGPVTSVLPYLIRRTEENTSIAGQTSRELMLIMKEKKRRKLAKSRKL
jgi:proline dehydrogenase